MRSLVLVCLGGVWVVTPVGARSAPDNSAPLPRPLDPLQAEATRLIEVQRRYGGVVTAVTDETITIVNPGGEERNEQIVQLGVSVVTVRIIPPLPAREFRASELLSERGFSESGGESRSYRLSDVRIGDRVDIGCHRVKGKDICDSISIQRRPGGRVPPGNVDRSVGLPPGADIIRWHDRCNAEQDFEEKGVPIPDRFLSPSELMERRQAPMPREVKFPRIPEAQP